MTFQSGGFQSADTAPYDEFTTDFVYSLKHRIDAVFFCLTGTGIVPQRRPETGAYAAARPGTGSDNTSDPA